jgi:hypothetical protein
VEITDPLVIKFTPGFTGHGGRLTAPVPGVSNVPEWYRSLARFNMSNDDITLGVNNNIGTDGAMVATKMCMPFFDALTGGYHYVLEDDLYVDLDPNGMPILSWGGEVMLVDKRPTIELPLPDNCHPIHYGWRMNWYYETPPGYSVLITHPMNRFDLPFYTMSGIVESDIWGLPVFTAFFLKRNFIGVIPKGTPLFQIIPFKRENWELQEADTVEDLDRHELMAENRRSRLYGYYKEIAWRKKFFGVKNKKIKDVNHDDE